MEPIENLVLEGGGVLGVSYVGALEVLYDEGVLPKRVINLAGSSVGTIFTGAMACGADIEFIRSLAGMNFGDFIDNGPIRGIYNILRYNGYCHGDYFCKWYDEIISSLVLRNYNLSTKGITLMELHELTGRDLYITTVNVTKKKLEILSWKNRPEIPLFLAARMSIGIPGVFVPVKYGGDIYIDGGFLNNYPIQAFHIDDIILPNTLGIMILTEDDDPPPVDPTATWDYISALAFIAWNNPQKLHVDEQDWKRTVKIKTKNIRSIDFNISPEQKEWLITRGKVDTRMAIWSMGIVSSTPEGIALMEEDTLRLNLIQPRTVDVNSNERHRASGINKQVLENEPSMVPTIDLFENIEAISRQMKQ